MTASSKAWPPIGWLWQDYERAAAWYSGDPVRLKMATVGDNTDRFWKTGENVKVHVPIAADISAMSSAMIFADSPVITVGDEKTQERIDEISEKTMLYNVLLQAAELASVYGGVFLKWSWAKTDGFPRLTAVPADSGMPYWMGGNLARVKLYTVVKEDENGGIWRLEETYTKDGKIKTKLYCGSENDIGTEHALNELEETRGILPESNSGTNTMLAFYVPNLLPNRSRPHLRFGRSDYDGLYGLFDELDEAYSAIQRETRMTKTTVIVPAEYLRKREAIFGGVTPYAKEKEWVYANETGAFTALDIDSDRTSSPITIVNPEIRAESRIAVCEDLVKRILMHAGYAPQSAGIDVMGNAESGTALNVRERKSIRTTETKKTYWWHALNDIIRAGLRLDAKVFGSGIDPETDFSIELPTNAQPDVSQLAQIVEQLERAGAASLEYKVRVLHPDWDDDQCAEEVERIRSEQSASAQAEIDTIINDIDKDGGGDE